MMMLSHETPEVSGVSRRHCPSRKCFKQATRNSELREDLWYCINGFCSLASTLPNTGFQGTLKSPVGYDFSDALPGITHLYWAILRCSYSS